MPIDAQDAYELEIPAGWDCAPLGDLVVEERGISYGVVQPGKHDDGGVPIVRVNNLRGGRILTEEILRVPAEIEADYARTRLRGGEVLLSLVGTLGECAVVPSELAGWNVARAVAVIPPRRGVDPHWLAMCLRSANVQALMRAWATTTVQATLNLRDVRRLPVLLPPEPVRSNITAALKQLDDKIEQNRRTGRTLEELARATFKAWFVDFEPVKAKAAGQTSFPGMPPAAFAALPDRLVDSALGPMPQGWAVVDIYQLATVVYGAPFASKLFNETEEGKPLIRIRDLQTHSPSIYTTERHAKGTLIQAGEIVVGMDGEFRLHYWTGPEAWLNQRLCSFKPLPLVPTMYLGEALRAPLDYVERSEAATTVIHLGKYDIDRFELLRPDKATLAAFDSITSPMLNLIVQTGAESAKLALLRDYLLPRLLSGRVQVSSVGRLTREAL